MFFDIENRNARSDHFSSLLDPEFECQVCCCVSGRCWQLWLHIISYVNWGRHGDEWHTDTPHIPTRCQHFCFDVFNSVYCWWSEITFNIGKCVCFQLVISGKQRVMLDSLKSLVGQILNLRTSLAAAKIWVHWKYWNGEGVDCIMYYTLFLKKKSSRKHCYQSHSHTHSNNRDMGSGVRVWGA
jgi:hypothetical protein